MMHADTTADNRESSYSSHEICSGYYFGDDNVTFFNIDVLSPFITVLDLILECI